ncbi:response regulator [Cohnella ginsengisoli]|uniref:response regulator n=1 Tax=Cohnella ginsengisoli TaxID=425004 RepID=UPI002406155F|nr:response regulator [Cohnella ginsengisoli]
MFHLLIVDDYPDQVESIAATIPLEELGIGEVYKAFSGAEALDMAKRCTVDIVITDILMPGMSGLELVKKIREGSKTTKCIFLSGHADFDYAKQAIELQSSHYLLKPVETDELIRTLTGVVAELHAEWQEIASRRRAVNTLREHLPLLGGELLNHLLQDRRYPRGVIADKMKMLDLPFASGDRVGMFIVRMEDGFDDFDDYDLSLMEFAVANIAEEIFGELYHIWHCKDAYDNLVFVLKAKKSGEEVSALPNDNGEEEWRPIEKMAASLHRSVSVYLKRSVSIAVAEQTGLLPEGLSRMHRICLFAVRRQIGGESDFFVTAREEPEQAIEGGLRVPYQPPLLLHLLETGSWERAAGKLSDIFAELAEKWPESPEYAQEVYFNVMGAFHYAAHRNGKQLGDIAGGATDVGADGSMQVSSLKQLRDRIHTVFARLMADAEHNTKDSRSIVVRRIHQLIAEDVSRDLSLQAISDHVRLHPAYISKVYRMETGMNLGDYVLQQRMELAAAMLLKDPNDKIYEIAERTGYMTTHYFSKVFKGYFGMTPLEYRERLNK